MSHDGGHVGGGHHGGTHHVPGSQPDPALTGGRRRPPGTGKAVFLLLFGIAIVVLFLTLGH